MKKNILLLLVIPIATVGAFASLKHVDVFKVDTQKSSVEWYAEKVTGKHNGTIRLISGELANNHGKFGGKFIIDMTSIACTDLEGEYKNKLEGHLKSEDFFSVKSHPTATFEISNMTAISGAKAGSPNFTVVGKMTIKGITKDITFPASVNFSGSSMVATANVVIDRSKFDVRYGSKSFFADIGDKAIYDEFTMKLKLVGSL